MGDRLISQESVLEILYEIKDNDAIPKNYGTILDVIRKVRDLPVVSINQDFESWIENRKEEAEQAWREYDDEQAFGETIAYGGVMEYLQAHNIKG
ncbi:hypothetical protein H9X90_05480 [Faecalicatena contorta]|uniref:hypothetical protein n=1 Tax=Faecalicatena contorta TaxID=39482 RepID=UPI0019616C9C|nr:hypothetical protein [Faecalicatena contorta]MBM6685454.1 hypothetical protein [Faecalicatena contorta]MBM6710196.1 hypothetical protein [Faecalicatena contorta]